MILITKIFQEQFRQVKKRLTESGFNIVPLHGYKAKKVELNYYTSYTTLGVEADHLRLIIHEDDSSEIQKAKKKEIWAKRLFPKKCPPKYYCPSKELMQNQKNGCCSWIMMGPSLDSTKIRNKPRLIKNFTNSWTN